MARWTDSGDVEPIGTFSSATDGHTLDCGRTTQVRQKKSDERRLISIPNAFSFTIEHGDPERRDHL